MKQIFQLLLLALIFFGCEDEDTVAFFLPVKEGEKVMGLTFAPLNCELDSMPAYLEFTQVTDTSYTLRKVSAPDRAATELEVTFLRSAFLQTEEGLYQAQSEAQDKLFLLQYDSKQQQFSFKILTLEFAWQEWIFYSRSGVDTSDFVYLPELEKYLGTYQRIDSGYQDYIDHSQLLEVVYGPEEVEGKPITLTMRTIKASTGEKMDWHNVLSSFLFEHTEDGGLTSKNICDRQSLYTLKNGNYIHIYSNHNGYISTRQYIKK